MNEFWEAVKERKEFLKEQRMGQFLYNVAWILYPDFAREIVLGSSIDPFYNDKNIPAFLTNLEYYLTERRVNK